MLGGDAHGHGPASATAAVLVTAVVTAYTDGAAVGVEMKARCPTEQWLENGRVCKVETWLLNAEAAAAVHEQQPHGGRATAPTARSVDRRGCALGPACIAHSPSP